MKKYRSIIFDFDGTLVKSIDVLLRVYDSLQEEMNLPNMDDVGVEKIRGLGIFQIINLLSLSYVKFPFYILKLKKKYREFVDDISPVPGIAYILMQLQKNYHLHILTSNDRDLVFQVLERYELNCFETITAERNFFGKHYALKKTIKQLKYDFNEVLYVGDEVRDIEACQKIDLDCCAVSWGLNNLESLKNKNPKYALSKPEELLDIL